MRFRLLLCVVSLLFVSMIGGAGWWFMHRKPDPAIHAEERARQGDLRELLLVQRDAMARHPEDMAGRVRVGLTLVKLGDGVSAEKTFRAIETEGADHVLALQGLGEADALQGHWKEVLQDVPSSGPTPAIAGRFLYLRASAQLALDDVPAAEATLAAARTADPDGASPHLIAARLAVKADDVAGAEAAVDEALRGDPVNVEALEFKLRLATLKGDATDAVAIADRAVAAAPWLLALRLDRANLQMRIPGQEAKAQADLDVILARAPRLPPALYLNAVLMARAGRIAEASAALERLGPAVEQFPRGLYIQAILSSQLGHANLAVSLAERYNTRFPDDRDGFLLLARTRNAVGHPELAAPPLERAVAAAKAAGIPPDPVLLETLADSYSSLGNEPGALLLRQQAASLAPADPAALRVLGLSQLRQGDISAGLETLDRSAGLAPPSHEASDRLFRAALGAGDLERAATVLDRRRAEDGETTPVRRMTAMLLAAKGETDSARQTLETILHADPNEISAKIDFASLLVAQGHAIEGEAMLQDVLKTDPGNLAALSAAMRVWVPAKSYDVALRAVHAAEASAPKDARFTAVHAELLIRSGDPKTALVMLDGLRTSGPLSPALLGLLAQAQEASGQGAAALATYHDALAANPANAELRSAQVALLMRDKRIDDAKASVREGLAHVPGAFGLQRALVLLEVQTSGVDAGLKLAAELRAKPEAMPAAALLKGDLLIGARRFDPAVEAFKVEFDQAPSQVLALRLAAAQVSAGHLDNAATMLRGWLDAHPDSPEVSGPLARLDERAGRFDLAVGDLESRLHRRPNDPAALNDLAWIYQTRNDPRALALAQRAYQLAPAPQIADTLGWIMLQRGDILPAIDLLQKAVAQRPEDPSLTYHLASALQKSGKADDGRKLLEPMLARPVGFEERPAAEQLLREIKAPKAGLP